MGGGAVAGTLTAAAGGGALTVGADIASPSMGRADTIVISNFGLAFGGGPDVTLLNSDVILDPMLSLKGAAAGAGLAGCVEVVVDGASVVAAAGDGFGVVLFDVEAGDGLLVRLNAIL